MNDQNKERLTQMMFVTFNVPVEIVSILDVLSVGAIDPSRQLVALGPMLATPLGRLTPS